MVRLLVHVEGQTEEMFVREVLAPYLRSQGYERVDARLLGNARQRGRRGGIPAWPVARKDILRHLKQDPDCSVTTMVDFYALPQTGDGAWPGRDQGQHLDIQDRASHIEEALAEDVAAHLGAGVRLKRFRPFIVVHEFEALLFSDCAAFARGIYRPALQSRFQAIRDRFPSPEAIDDSPQTAPSKRIVELVPGYEKPLLGNLAAIEVGLAAMRAQCPHFNGWVRSLEAIVEG
jgi:hypothetical protein